MTVCELTSILYSICLRFFFIIFIIYEFVSLVILQMVVHTLRHAKMYNFFYTNSIEYFFQCNALKIATGYTNNKKINNI